VLYRNRNSTDEYLDPETYNILSGSFEIYFPTKQACPQNKLLEVTSLTFEDALANDLIAEGWVTFDEYKLTVNTDHPSNYARTIDCTGVMTDGTNPLGDVTLTFHITITFVGRAQPLVVEDPETG